MGPTLGGGHGGVYYGSAVLRCAPGTHSSRLPKHPHPIPLPTRHSQNRIRIDPDTQIQLRNSQQNKHAFLEPDWSKTAVTEFFASAMLRACGEHHGSGCRPQAARNTESCTRIVHVHARVWSPPTVRLLSF